MSDISGLDPVVSTIQAVDQIVEGRISSALNSANTMQSVALNTISQLSNVNLDLKNTTPPNAPKLDTKINLKFDLPQIQPNSFGTISTSISSLPSLDPVPELPNLSIPEFRSSIGALSIPAPPSWTAPSAPPSAPTIENITVPDIPNITIPALPALSEITVPTFAGLNLPVFDAKAPEFQGTAVSTVLQWSEPAYYPEILDEVLTVIRDMWSGGLGIPETVEQAMWVRAAEREELAVSREIESISEEFSMRGFTTPPGMQAARVDQLRQDLAVKKLGLNRELTIQIAQWQIENVRFACEQAVAAENLFVNLFMNQAQRLFDAAKYQIEAQLNLYNAQVALFNARMNGYQVSAQVFNTLVQAELSKIEAFKAEIEAEVARGQINEQKVRTYAAMIEALRAQTEIYRTKMQSAEVKSNIIRNKIEAFLGQVQAYAQQVQAEKIKFDAYDSRVRAEASKAGIIDAEARAFAALIQGKAAEADLGAKKAEVAIQKNRMRLEAYQSELESKKAIIQAQLADIQTRAQAFIADTQRFSARAQAEAAKSQVEVAAKEVELRTNLNFYQVQLQAYISNMEQLIRKAAVTVDALKAAGGIASTLAAGAMAGVHVGATLSGGGSAAVGFSNSFSLAKTYNKAKQEVYSYEGTGGNSIGDW